MLPGVPKNTTRPVRDDLEGRARVPDDRPPAPRIEELRVRNYRALRDLRLDKLSPLTVLIGPNGSGKSTVFDVFAFVSECFTEDLPGPWGKRGGLRELRSREAEGPICIELRYREPGKSLMTYLLEIDEDAGAPVVRREVLRWTKAPGAGRPYHFLDFSNGSGYVVSGDDPSLEEARGPETLTSRSRLAVSALGQLQRHPRVAALREFITGWYLSYLSADDARGYPEAGPQDRLSKTGDNLANVVQYLREQHPDVLERIQTALRQRVPRLDAVEARTMDDNRLLLAFKDAPFVRPILARFASDGTLKMLAYLVVLYDPALRPLIGIEEPENHIHPRLLPGLASECLAAASRSQLLVATHSPFFIDELRPEDVWVLERDEQGYAQAQLAAKIPGIREHVEAGGKLGHLWTEGYFGFGDPLCPTNSSVFPPGRSRGAGRGR